MQIFPAETKLWELISKYPVATAVNSLCSVAWKLKSEWCSWNYRLAVTTEKHSEINYKWKPDIKINHFWWKLYQRMVRLNTWCACFLVCLKWWQRRKSWFYYPHSVAPKHTAINREFFLWCWQQLKINESNETGSLQRCSCLSGCSSAGSQAHNDNASMLILSRYNVQHHSLGYKHASIWKFVIIIKKNRLTGRIFSFEGRIFVQKPKCGETTVWTNVT